MSKPAYQLTLINDTSEEFYVEWIGEDGKLYKAAFPVRDGKEYPDQRAYALAMVETTFLGQIAANAKPAEPAPPEAGSLAASDHDQPV
jgi:hypothetical protein